MDSDKGIPSAQWDTKGCQTGKEKLSCVLGLFSGQHLTWAESWISIHGLLRRKKLLCYAPLIESWESQGIPCVIPYFQWGECNFILVIMQPWPSSDFQTLLPLNFPRCP